jgi:hypothetical protein
LPPHPVQAKPKRLGRPDAIIELLDDEEGYRIAIERLRRERPGIPLEDVERELGLAG